MTTRGLIFVSQMTAGTNPKSLGAWFSSWERNAVSGRGYLVDGRELRAHRAGGVQPAAVAEAARRPLAAAVQRSARRLLPLQRPGGRLVPPELGATLAVAVRRAGLALQPVVAARPGGQALGDVLGVGGRSALTGAPAGERDGASAAGGAVAAAGLCSDDLRNRPAAGAGPLQLPGLSDQAALAADDPQLVLVGRGQVDGAGGDGRAQVAGAGDVQVGQNLGTGQREGMEGLDQSLSPQAETSSWACLTSGRRGLGPR